MKIEFNPTMSDSTFIIVIISSILIFVSGIWLGMIAEEQFTKIENFDCNELFDYIIYQKFRNEEQIERYFNECVVDDNKKEVWHDYTQGTEITNSIDWNSLHKNQTAIIEWKMQICESSVYVVPIKSGEPYYYCLDWGSHNLDNVGGK